MQINVGRISGQRRAARRDEAGIDTLNTVWRSPGDMPSGAELDDPSAWIRRTSLPSAA